MIDTNIWVSGLLWRGLPWKLLRLAKAGRVELCITPSMLDELADVLTYERLQPRLERLALSPSDLVSWTAALASVFDDTEGDPIVTADPDDDVFLHCASVAGAVYVVSGDHHLLDLRSHEGIPVLTIRDFLAKEFSNQLD